MNSRSKTEPKDFGQLLTELQEKYKLVKQGGGPKRIAKEHEKGKLTARERVDYLIDEQSDFLEIGAFAADGMYEEEGGCP